jgi:hypothetical protein
MKRTLLIVGGIAVVLVLIGVWAYILFSGTTSENISFNDFGFGDTTDSTVIIPSDEPLPEEVVAPDDQEQRLRQLTTTPVAGFMQTVVSSTSDPVVRYVESGTGHIYETNLFTEESVRVSATTIPLATKAAVTPNGQHVLIQSDTGPRSTFIIGTISSSSDRLNNFELNEDILSFNVTNDNVFLYATRGTGELVVKSYEPESAVTATLFSIPFVDATISWGHDLAGPHTVYPKATRQLEGYAYSYVNGIANRINATGFGLAAVGSSVATIYSEIVDGQYRTYTINNDSLIPSQTPLVFMPEKCAFTNSSDTTAICGADFTDPSNLMPDSWYRGTDIADDAIWEYNTVRQSARLLADPETATGRQIDLINPRFSTNDFNLFFQNKSDQTLWIYQYVVTN